MSTSPYTLDPRYTDDAIASYSDQELDAHLEERRNQLAGAQDRLHGIEAWIAGMTDEQLETSREGTDAFANAHSHAAEIAVQKRAIAKLAREIAHRAAEKRLDQTATQEPSLYAERRIQRLLEEQGLPGYEHDDAHTRSLTRQMWGHAVMAYSATVAPGTYPTERWTASRIADVWMTLYADPTADDPIEAERAPAGGQL